MRGPKYVKYVGFPPDAGVFAYAADELDRHRIARNIGYGDNGDVLATDTKRGLWYFTYKRRYYYGPFKSAQEARRAFDNYKGRLDG